MAWNIVLFETNRQEKPVAGFIKRQNAAAKAKIIREINLLGEFGPQLPMPHTKRLGRDIFELRIRGKEELRILYTFIKKDIYLLHAFKKQTQKTPAKEIDTAIARFKLLTSIYHI